MIQLFCFWVDIRASIAAATLLAIRSGNQPRCLPHDGGKENVVNVTTAVFLFVQQKKKTKCMKPQIIPEDEMSYIQKGKCYMFSFVCDSQIYLYMQIQIFACGGGIDDEARKGIMREDGFKRRGNQNPRYGKGECGPAEDVQGVGRVEWRRRIKKEMCNKM